MSGALETLDLRRERDGVVVLGLDRPARANALTRRMFDEIVATCADLDADPEVRAVVLTGSGGAFCVGYDIDDAGDFAALGPHAALALQDSGVRAVRAVHDLSRPVGGFAEAGEAIRAAFGERDVEKMIAAVPDAMVDAMAVAGTRDQVRAKLDEIERAGALDHVIVYPPSFRLSEGRCVELVESLVTEAAPSAG